MNETAITWIYGKYQGFLILVALDPLRSPVYRSCRTTLSSATALRVWNPVWGCCAEAAIALHADYAREVLDYTGDW